MFLSYEIHTTRHGQNIVNMAAAVTAEMGGKRQWSRTGGDHGYGIECVPATVEPIWKGGGGARKTQIRR